MVQHEGKVGLAHLWSFMLHDLVVTAYSEESAQRLIARANENGGPDNITAVVVRVSLS